MPLALLLDENLPPLYRTQLMRRQPALTVWMVGDPGAPAYGTLDPDILIWCETHGFLLVTNNRKSMPRHLQDHLAAGHHAPGIITLDWDRGIAAHLEDLVLIAEVGRADEFQDRIEYLPL